MPHNFIYMEDKELTTVSEPAAAMLSEDVRKSGLLSQVMKLSQPDELGRIKLTSKMRADVAKAERDLEDGKCFSEDDFKNRFAKWL